MSSKSISMKIGYTKRGEATETYYGKMVLSVALNSPLHPTDFKSWFGDSVIGEVILETIDGEKHNAEILLMDSEWKHEDEV